MTAGNELLFGLLALQNGLIDQDQLVAAFRGWTRDRSRPLADYLAARGDLDAEQRAGVEAMVGLHLKKHGGDAGKSLAAVPAGRSTRESLAALGDAEVEHTLAQLASGPDGGADRTASYAVGTASADGQRFRVLRPHARGGLGAVFVALDAELNREVALKRILDQHADDPVSRARFVLEAEITGGLEHPGIVPIYGLGTYADGRPFYAMRFIKGDSLKEAADRFHADEAIRGDPGRRALGLRQLLRRFTDVCDAIGYAHARGVLHRDIKPGNIIVGKHGETLVVDWGLAKATGRADPGAEPGERTLTPSSASGTAETLPGSALGTPAYMSPEQAEGDLEHLGPRSDVYSLGATLYYLLTGRPPAEGEIGEVLRAVQRGDVTPPRRHDPAIDPALEAVCLKAMAHTPADRYASARALAEDVERWMADEPVSAYREPLSARAGRWARRHRPLVAGAAALLVAAVVALSTGTVLLTRANARTERERLRAEAARALAEENFRKARQAVDEYFTRVSESTLLSVPGLQPLRKELLESARRYYQEFLRRRADDPAVRADVGAASYRLALVTHLLGTADEARPLMEQARAAYAGLTRDRPSEIKYWVDLAICDNDVGRLYHAVGDREAAKRYHREALEIRRRNALAHPGGARFQDELGRSLANLAMIVLDEGRADEALRLTEEVIALLEGAVGGADPATRLDLPTDLGGAFNKVGSLRAALAGHYQRRGYLLRRVGRTDEAVRSYRRSLAAYEALLAADPGSLDYRGGYASSGSGIASMLEFMGFPDEARAVAAKLKPVAERLIAENPSVPGYRNNLALLLLLQGNLDLKAGRPGDAARWFKEALALYERLGADDPRYSYYRHRTAAACRHLGTIPAPHVTRSEALDYLRRSEALLDGLPNRDTVSTYDLACTRALIAGRLGGAGGEAAGRDRYERMAMETLRQAIDAGYRDMDNIRSDTDLDVLRTRADFRRLLAAAEAGARAGPPAGPRPAGR